MVKTKDVLQIYPNSLSIDRWNAEYYKRNSDKQFQLGMNFCNSIQFKEDERVLDVGCGEGRITIEVAKRIPRGKISGIDISANMIHEAKKSFYNIPNASFECCDVITFDAKNMFDRAISLDAFHWIEDQFKAFTNIYEALKPGGRLDILMQLLSDNPIFQAMKSSKWSSRIQSNRACHQAQNPKTIGVLLGQCGFVCVDAYIKTDKYIFKNQKELCDWLMGWVPHATGLDEDMAQEFVEDVTKASKSCIGDLMSVGSSLHVKAQKCSFDKNE